MKHESTNDPIRPLLKAIDSSIAKARARRLGVDATDTGTAGVIFPATDGPTDSTSTEQPTQYTNADGTPMLKAKRKSTTSFDAPMPTRSVWDRKAG